jgi:hypothetical protein
MMSFDRSVSFYDTYDVSHEYGFLSSPQASFHPLPPEFSMFDTVISNLENTDGEYFRLVVDNLSGLNYSQSFYVDLVCKQSKDVQKIVYSTFTFIAQKYIRCMGKSEQVSVIPYEIGLIWHHSALTFKLPTVTTYSAVVLSNWLVINANKPISLSNIDAAHYISGTPDEAWFYRIHIAIEQLGGKLLEPMFNIENTTSTVERTLTFLCLLEKVLNEIREIIEQMRVGCNPDVYWNCVRIFLGGYTSQNGLPEGVRIQDTDLPSIRFEGGSAAQSTLIQAFDVFLGVEHTRGDGLSHHGVHDTPGSPSTVVPNVSSALARPTQTPTALDISNGSTGIVPERVNCSGGGGDGDGCDSNNNLSNSRYKTTPVVARCATSPSKTSSSSSSSFLQRQRAYMPQQHVAYLEALESHDCIRSIVQRYNDEQVTQQFNAVISAFAKFRAAHYSIVRVYISSFLNAAKIANETGELDTAERLQKNNIFGDNGAGGLELSMLDEFRADTTRAKIL